MSSLPPKSEAARRRPVSALQTKLWELTERLDERLDEPSEVLELLVSAAAKGEQAVDAWSRLHTAATRFDKTAELAFAYEQVTLDRRIKLLPLEQQAFIFLQAAQFFSEILDDTAGAVRYAEWALTAVPGDAAAFARFEALLTRAGATQRLAELYAEQSEREIAPDLRLDRLRRAHTHASEVEGADELAIRIGKRILELAPEDEPVHDDVMRRLLAGGRHAEVVELLESSLDREPAPGPAAAKLHREQLVDLCFSVLKSPERALLHVEGLLRLDPSHAMARQAAEGLLEDNQLRLRAAAALSDALEATREIERAVDMLTFELKHIRGPRRMEVQRRLGILRQDELADPAGALELLAPLVAGDPSDDALRTRFVSLSLSLNQTEQAARLLSRALQTQRDPAVRARVGVDVGAVYAKSGDMARAQAAFEKVLESAADDQASLAAARRLSEGYAASGQVEKLSFALECSVRFEPEKEARQAAARRLARLSETEAPNPARAILAFRALIGSPWTDEALTRLEAIYRETGEDSGLADVLSFRAERAKDPAVARELSVQALELRTRASGDAEAAIRAYAQFAETFGASHEVFTRLMPLLEQTGRYKELAGIVAADAELAQGDQKKQLLLRLSRLQRQQLSDPLAALATLRKVLELGGDPTEARTELEALLNVPEVRLSAARLLEPIYAVEPGSGLLRVLETLVEAAETLEERLAAAHIAIELAEGSLADRRRALAIATLGLRFAVQEARPLVKPWLSEVQRLAGNADGPSLRDALLAALGESAIDGPELFELTCVAAQAAATAGDSSRAVELYKRALSFDPASRAVILAIDELLVQLGTPHERLALYASALEGEADPQHRRDLFYASARIQRMELQQPAAAVVTLRRACEETPLDLAVHEALLDALAEADDAAGILAELDRVLPQLAGEQRSVALLRLAETAERSGESVLALVRYRELLAVAELSTDVLTAIERLAQEQGDGATLHEVLERRLAATHEPKQRLSLLERLGNAESWQLGDSTSAAQHWLEGARLAEGALQEVERARRLYDRVLDAEPRHREAAERILELDAEAGDWTRIPEAFAVVLESAEEADLVALLTAMEPRALRSGNARELARLLERALGQSLDPSTARVLQLQRVRVLSHDPTATEEAALAFRDLLQQLHLDPDPEIQAFVDFLQRSPRTDARAADLRWLYRFRVERAGDSLPILLAWAAAEEIELGDTAAAVSVYEHVVTTHPDQLHAWAELARLRAANGDLQGAYESLQALRERVAADARPAVDLSLASLLVAGLDRPRDALSLVRPILEDNPSDRDALSIVHRALTLAPTRDEAAQLLESSAERFAEPVRRAEVLEALLAVSANVPELAPARGRWLGQLLETKSDQPEEVLRVALRGAEAAPGALQLWDLAERVARRLGTPRPVAEAQARVFEGALQAGVADELGRRMVEFHEEWFDEPERVVQLLERILTLSPGSDWAFERLKLSFNAAARWDELFALYDARLATGLPLLDRGELLREAAMAARDFAGQPERAMRYLEALNSQAPGDGRVEASLERLYERHGKKRPLIELLGARKDKLPVGDKAQLTVRIAALWLDIEEPAPALALAEELLREPARKGDAVQLLERLLTLPASAEGGPESSLVAATRHLKAHYRERGSSVDVVRMLEIEKQVAQSRAERRALLEQIVELRLSELDDGVGAFAAAAELVLLEPAERSHRALLSSLAGRMSCAELQAEVLVRAARLRPDDTTAAELFNEAAAVYQHPLGNPAAAIELYREVTALDAPAASAELLALRELSRLLRAEGHASERTRVLERLADLEDDVAARRAALGEAATLASTLLADPARAIVAYRKCIAEDARDLPAMDGLCAALEQLQRWDELIAALEARASIETQEAARRDRVRLARLHTEVKGDPTTAVEAWWRVVELHGADAESFVALSQLLAEEQRWSELAELLANEIQSATEGERQLELWAELGALHEHRTLRPIPALEAYVTAGDWPSAMRVAGARQAEAAAGRRVCERLLALATRAWGESGEGPESAAATTADWALVELCQRFSEAGEHAEVVEQLLSGAELPFAERRRRELRREAACLASDRLDDGERAITLFQELLEQDADDEVARASVTRLAVLLEEKGRFEPIATLWENQATVRAAGGDVAGAQALWARAGELLEERLADRQRAVSAYEQGAALGGEVCLEALARIHRDEGALPLLAADLEQLLKIASGDALGERSLRLAATYSELALPEKARQTLEAALPRVVDGAPLRTRLAVLYREAQDYTALARLVEEEADRAVERVDQLRLLREAAELHLQQRRHASPAVPLLERAVGLEPDEPLLRLRLAQALRGCERLDDAAAVLQDQVVRYGARRPKDRALIHHELGRVLLAQNNPGGALDELEAAARIDPAHPHVLHLLARTALEQGDLDRAERGYRAQLMVNAGRNAEDAPSRGEALIALGEIAAKRGDSVRADEFLSSAFEAALEDPREAQRLEQALRGRARPELFARVLELRLEQGVPSEEAAGCLSDLTDLYATVLGNLQTVRERLHERARRIDAELRTREVMEDGPWAALGRVYSALGDKEAEARVIEERVETARRSSRPAAHPELYYRLAEVRLQSPETFDSGLELIEQALTVGSEYERAERILAGAFPPGREPLRGLELLERIARARGDAAAVVTIIQKRLALGVLDMHSIREGLALSTKLGAADVAESLLAAVLDSQASHLSSDEVSWLKLELAKLRRANGEVFSALDLEEQASATLAPTEARAILVGVAKEALALGDVGRGGRVLAVLQREDPEAREIWEPLLDLYRATDQPEQLVNLLNATAPLVPTQEERSRLRLEQADTLIQVLGRRSDAILVLKRLVADDPSQRAARLQLSELLSADGREEELIQLLSEDLEALRADRSAPGASALTLRLLGILERHARHEEALSLCRSSLAEDPSSRELLEAQLRLAKASGDRRVLAEALEGLLQLERGPAAAALCKSLVTVHRALRDEAGIDRALELGFAACPADSEICQQLAGRYRERGEPGRVAELLERAVAENPDDRALFERWIDAYRQAGDHAAALAALDRYLAHRSADASLHRLRGTLLGELGRGGEAVSHLEAAMQSDPSVAAELVQALERAIARAEPVDSVALVLRLIDVLEQTNDVAGARARLSDLSHKAPTNRALLSRLAELDSKQGELESAIESYAALVELESGEGLVRASIALAELCAKVGRPHDARTALERAHAESPHNPIVRARLAAVLESAGAHRQLAELLLEDADRESRPAERMGKLLRVGDLLLSADGGVEQAIAVFQRARKEAPDSIDTAILLARALTRVGRIEEALVPLNALIEASRGKRSRVLSPVYEEKCNVHLEEGFLSDAVTALAKAFEMDPKNARLGIRLGQLALESDEEETALRAFRGVAIMKTAESDGSDCARPETKAEANYGLALLAQRAGDPRRVRVLVSKALSENPDHPGARSLLDELDGR